MLIINQRSPGEAEHSTALQVWILGAATASWRWFSPYVSAHVPAVLPNAGAGPAWIIVILNSRLDINLRLVHRGVQRGLHFPTGSIIYA